MILHIQETFKAQHLMMMMMMMKERWYKLINLTNYIKIHTSEKIKSDDYC